MGLLSNSSSLLRAWTSVLGLLLLHWTWQPLVAASHLWPRGDELSQRLSRPGLVSKHVPPRWSSFDAPVPALVVNVETEADVVATVKYCAARDIPFLARNGGNGFSTTFNLGSHGVLINLARLNQVTFNDDRTRATIGGGSSVNNTIAHAHAASALVVTGNCNCVGTLGAALGGGYGNLIGLFGLGVDNVLSLRVVTADGRLRNVDASSDEADLFWGLLGAAPNLAVVTSAVYRAYPAATPQDLQAWTGALTFHPDKLERVVQAIQDLHLEPPMNVFLYFMSRGGPPTIVVAPFLHGGRESTGRAVFASLYQIGPTSANTTVLPYNRWNAGGDGLCAPGARKPSYGAGVETMDPATWRRVWNEYVVFQAKPGAQNTVVVLEAYSLDKARSVDPASTAFPHRQLNFNALVVPWYTDASLDVEAQAFGRTVRDLWRTGGGRKRNSTYVNFAHGDETLQDIYGDSLARLRAVKRRYDPEDRFNQWFPIR